MVCQQTFRISLSISEQLDELFFSQTGFLKVLVNGQVLKFFGSEKQLAEAVKAAGYLSVADRLADGYTLNLPCRVVTKPNGKVRQC